MIRLCPNCRRQVYSRNIRQCGFCGVVLPVDLFSENYSGTTVGPTTQVPQRFQPLWDRLVVLKNKDSNHKVFGASRHQYRSICVTEAEMSEFESWCGVAMPLSYRDFMVHVGHGAGPYYGLLSPAMSRREIQCCLTDWGEDLPQPVHIHRPFPFSITQAQTARERQIAGDKEPWIESTWPMNGCIPISHHGCWYWSVLVIVGECAGRVWDLACEGSPKGLWLPAKRPSGSILIKSQLSPLPEIPVPPTFEEWLFAWIERAMTDLGTQQSN